MNIGEVSIIQDLMNLDIEIKFSENLITLEKNYSTLLSTEFPEEGFNFSHLIKEKVRQKINIIERDENEEMLEHLADLYEIINNI